MVVPVRSSLTDRLCDSPADFHSFNDYFDEQRTEGCNGKPYVDLWDTDHPGKLHRNVSLFRCELWPLFGRALGRLMLWLMFWAETHNRVVGQTALHGSPTASAGILAGVDLNGTGAEGGYEEALFAERALSIIGEHPVTSPLYLYYALHTSCVGVKRPGGDPGN